MADPIYDDQEKKESQVGGAASDEKNAKSGGDNPTGGLKNAEENPTQPNTDNNKSAPGADKKLSPSLLSEAEANAPWNNLYSPGKAPEKSSLKKRIAAIPGRRKAFLALGTGGVVSLVLAILTVAPVFRIPSLMGSILGFVGEQVDDVIEHRAQRLIVSYLIKQAGGNPDNYVISGSLTDSLWKTFHVNRIEERIKQQTGIEIVRGDDGEMHLKHKGEDLGVVRDYNDVIIQLEGHPTAQKDFKKIVRVMAKARERVFSAGTRKAFERRYLLRMSVPEKNPNLTDAENKAKLKKQQISVVTKMNISLWNQLFDCVISDKCDFFKKNGQPSQSLPQESEATKDSAEEFKKAVQEASDETTEEVSRTTQAFTKVFQSKLLAKIIAAAGTASFTAGIVTAVDFSTVLNHFFANTVYDYPAVYAFPSTLAANSSGAMYAQWLGFADNIKAGRMDLLFIATLNEQIAGAEKASTYNMTYGKNAAKGVPPDFRVDSNARYPAQSVMHFYRNYNPQYKVSNTVMELWYDNVHPIIEKVGEWGSEIIKFLTGNIVERALMAIFGENWEEKAALWAIETITGFLGASVDPLAKGAQWMNQVFIGGQAAMNTYCSVNLGCRALTPIVDKPLTDTPLLYNGGSLVTQGDREDMALLPLKDRLFSLDEPNSLLNTTFRSMPSSNSPIDWLSTTLNQVASLPSNLAGAFTARSYAEQATLEQQADVAGIQIMGGTVEDFAKDIAPEIRQQVGDNPECPVNDPQTTFNHCQADKEVARSLMCWLTDCPEYVGYQEPDSAAGFAANLRRVWESKQAAASLW